MASKKRLPSAYQEVEWIEATTNGPHIDTGISLGANDFSISLVFEQTGQGNGERPIVSIWEGRSNYWNMFTQPQTNAPRRLDVYTAGHHTMPNYTYVNEKYEVSFTRNGNSWELSQNDSTITWTYSQAVVNNTTLKLFKRGDLSASGIPLRMYSFVLSMSNTKVLDLIPCYRKSDGEIGMYDTVSKTFYTNAGTGTFTKGADV